MNKSIKFIAVVIVLFVFSGVFHAQEKLKRTTYKTEKYELGAGGTVSIIGAPLGSIAIEGWNKNEVEVSAEIEVQATTEADLALLAMIDTMVVDPQFGHIRVLSYGVHDREYLKKISKKFPKRLIDAPFSINYKIKVPTFCDLDVNAGTGDFTLSKVEGSFSIRAISSNAMLDLIGGTIDATFGSGKVAVKINPRSWRGRQVSIQLASGNMDVLFAKNMNAEIDAAVLRSGKISRTLDDLVPREQTKFSDTEIKARVGSGGARFAFTLGAGELKLGNW